MLNFNCIPEPVVAFSRRALAVPVTQFYDDQGVHEPSYARGSGQSVHFELHELLRFHFDLGKHVPWGRSVVYTGVVTDWTCDSQAEGFVSVGVSTERRAKVMSIIDAAVEKWSLTPAEASSLRGKARYCVCPVFGRVGLAAVTLLSKRQKATGDTSELDDELADVLAFLRVVIRVMPSFRVPIYRDLRPAIVVLTDASFATGHTWLGFFVHCPYLNRSWWAGMPTPPWLLALLASSAARNLHRSD